MSAIGLSFPSRRPFTQLGNRPLPDWRGRSNELNEVLVA